MANNQSLRATKTPWILIALGHLRRGLSVRSQLVRSVFPIGLIRCWRKVRTCSQNWENLDAFAQTWMLDLAYLRRATNCRSCVVRKRCRGVTGLSGRFGFWLCAAFGFGLLGICGLVVGISVILYWKNYAASDFDILNFSLLWHSLFRHVPTYVAIGSRYHQSMTTLRKIMVLTICWNNFMQWFSVLERVNFWNWAINYIIVIVKYLLEIDQYDF